MTDSRKPALRPADLEEVDRLIALAETCKGPGADHLIDYTGRNSIIRSNAIVRAAEILGLETKADKDEPPNHYEGE